MLTPDLTTFDEFRTRGLRPQVVCCIIYDQQVLMVYKKEFDLWQFPQGGIENKETLQNAFVRELKEELGVKFFNQCSDTIEVVGQGTVDFPQKAHGVKALKTDAGAKVLMVGKHYYFCVVQAKSSNIDLDTTQFDDFKWLNFEQAQKLVEAIKQPGKKRISQRILLDLSEKKWIK